MDLPEASNLFGSAGGSSPGAPMRRGWHLRKTFKMLADFAPFGILVTDPRALDNPIVSANRTFCTMTGYPEAETLGRNCRFLQGEETDPQSVADIRAAVEAGEPIQRELLNYRQNGEPFWNELNLAPIHDSAGRLINFIGLQNDVTLRRTAVRQGSQAQQLLQDLTDNMPGFLFQRRLAADGRVEFTFWSGSLHRMLGTQRPIRLFEDFLDVVHPEDREMLSSAITSPGGGGGSGGDISYRVVAADGRIIWIRSSNRRREDAGGEVVWDGCAIDVTSEHVAHERLFHLRNFDPLTGLMTRSRFEEHISEALRRLGPNDRLLLTVVEVDEVMEVRDLLGIAAADNLVGALASRLSGLVGREGVVARTGEDRFEVLMRPLNGSPTETAEFLSRSLAAPIQSAAGELRVKPHIGVAAYPFEGAPDGGSPANPAQELMQQAKIAMAEGRRELADQPVRFSPELQQQMALRVRLKQSLSQDIVTEQFELHYQPVIHLRSMQLLGAEALLRWRHPELGLQTPDLFIPLAEETGDILSLGAWVLGAGLAQLRRWKDQGRRWTLSLNVSPVQIRRPDFAATVEALLARTGADPALVVLELTESTVVEGTGETKANLQRLRALGIGLAIDDFGAGYSGLRYLTTLPVTSVKIDRSLVRNIGAVKHGAAVIEGVLELVRRLDLTPVCEGIETAEQLAFLQAHDVRLGQGYYFSRPLPLDDFEAFAAGWAGSRSAA